MGCGAIRGRSIPSILAGSMGIIAAPPSSPRPKCATPGRGPPTPVSAYPPPKPSHLPRSNLSAASAVGTPACQGCAPKVRSLGPVPSHPMGPTPQQVLAVLSTIQDPDLGRDVVSLGMIKELDLSPQGKGRFNFEL